MKKEIRILKTLEKEEFHNLFAKVILELGEQAFLMEYLGEDLSNKSGIL